MNVVSLTLAKQLAKADFPQENCLFYYQGSKEELLSEKGYVLSYREDMLSSKDIRLVAAPTADEILEQLPSPILTEEEKYVLRLEIVRVGKFWEIQYRDIEDIDNGGFHDLPGTMDSSLSDAAAKMWLSQSIR